VPVFDLLKGVVVVVAGVSLSLGTGLLGRDSPYEVTGMSPQSMTLPQKLNGLDCMGLVVISVRLLSLCVPTIASLAELTRYIRH